MKQTGLATEHDLSKVWNSWAIFDVDIFCLLSLLFEFNFLKVHLFLRRPTLALYFPFWVFQQIWLEEPCTALYRICFLEKGKYVDVWGSGKLWVTYQKGNFKKDPLLVHSLRNVPIYSKSIWIGSKYPRDKLMISKYSNSWTNSWHPTRPPCDEARFEAWATYPQIFWAWFGLVPGQSDFPYLIYMS